jgi:hypothetical protein
LTGHYLLKINSALRQLIESRGYVSLRNDLLNQVTLRSTEYYFEDESLLGYSAV